MTGSFEFLTLNIVHLSNDRPVEMPILSGFGLLEASCHAQKSAMDDHNA
jgi:hypothetical protein